MNNPVVNWGDRQVEITAYEIDPGEPDQTSGPPDAWSQGYGPDVNVTAARFCDDESRDLTSEELDRFISECSDDINNAVLDHEYEEEMNSREDAADRAYDEWRDRNDEEGRRYAGE